MGIWFLENGNWQPFDLPQISGSDEPGHFAIGQRDEIWVAAAQGLYVFDGSSWNLHPSDVKLGQGNFRLKVTANGSAWLGYRGEERKGLIMFDGETWHHFLTDVNITEISPAPDGRVWVGTDNGDIFIFDGSSIVQTFTVYDYSPYNQYFGARSIWDIEFDDEGSAWVASESRIYRFDGKTWKPYFTPEKFLSISQMAIDRNEHIWLVFFNQFAQFDGHHWNWVIDEHGYYTSGSALAKDPQGKIWWADSDEVHSLDPDAVYFPSIKLAQVQRFSSGDGLMFLELCLLLLLISMWLNATRPALVTVALGFFFLFVANYIVFPDHWINKKLLSTWPIIDPGFFVLAGGVIGTLISRLPTVLAKNPKGELRFAIAGSAVGIVLGLIQIYFFMAVAPLA